MKKEEIIRMAREAAKEFGSWNDWDSDKPASGPNGNDPHEEREYWISLVEFIAAAAKAEEREACAKVCDDFERAKWESVKNISQNGGRLAFAGPMHCAAAIRARSQS